MDVVICGDALVTKIASVEIASATAIANATTRGLSFKIIGVVARVKVIRVIEALEDTIVVTSAVIITVL